MMCNIYELLGQNVRKYEHELLLTKYSLHNNAHLGSHMLGYSITVRRKVLSIFQIGTTQRRMGNIGSILGFSTF